MWRPSQILNCRLGRFVQLAIVKWTICSNGKPVQDAPSQQSFLQLQKILNFFIQSTWIRIQIPCPKYAWTHKMTTTMEMTRLKRNSDLQISNSFLPMLRPEAPLLVLAAAGVRATVSWGKSTDLFSTEMGQILTSHFFPAPRSTGQLQGLSYFLGQRFSVCFVLKFTLQRGEFEKREVVNISK